MQVCSTALLHAVINPAMRHTLAAVLDVALSDIDTCGVVQDAVAECAGPDVLAAAMGRASSVLDGQGGAQSDSIALGSQRWCVTSGSTALDRLFGGGYDDAPGGGYPVGSVVEVAVSPNVSDDEGTVVRRLALASLLAQLGQQHQPARDSALPSPAPPIWLLLVWFVDDGGAPSAWSRERACAAAADDVRSCLLQHLHSVSLTAPAIAVDASDPTRPSPPGNNDGDDDEGLATSLAFVLDHVVIAGVSSLTDIVDVLRRHVVAQGESTPNTEGRVVLSGAPSSSLIVSLDSIVPLVRLSAGLQRASLMDSSAELQVLVTSVKAAIARCRGVAMLGNRAHKPPPHQRLHHGSNEQLAMWQTSGGVGLHHAVNVRLVVDVGASSSDLFFADSVACVGGHLVCDDNTSNYVGATSERLYWTHKLARACFHMCQGALSNVSCSGLLLDDAFRLVWRHPGFWAQLGESRRLSVIKSSSAQHHTFCWPAHSAILVALNAGHADDGDNDGSSDASFTTIRSAPRKRRHDKRQRDEVDAPLHPSLTRSSGVTCIRCYSLLPLM